MRRHLPGGVLLEEWAEHGRGLFLVAALAKEWGVRVEPDGAGKTVWFRCVLDGS